MTQRCRISGTLLQVSFVLAVFTHNTKRRQLTFHTEFSTLQITIGTYSVLPESFWSFVGLPQVNPSKLPLSDSEFPSDFSFWTPSGFTFSGEFDTTSIRFFFLRIIQLSLLSFFRFRFVVVGIFPTSCRETEWEEEELSVGMDSVVFWQSAPFFRSMRIFDEFYSSLRNRQKKQKKTIVGCLNLLCHPHSSQQSKKRIVPRVAEKTSAKMKFSYITRLQKKRVFLSWWIVKHDTVVLEQQESEQLAGRVHSVKMGS